MEEEEEEEEEEQGSCNSGHGLRVGFGLRGTSVGAAEMLKQQEVMPYNSAHHCVVEVENFLFVLGGEDQWNPNVPLCLFQFDFISLAAEDPHLRASFYACRLDKNLYVIGGRNETGYLSSVECYNLETNEWRGVHNGEYVPWLYCYDPVMDVWARKQDMNTKRAIHTLAVMNDRLYAIGGNHLKGFSHLDVMLVECYDPKGDQWNILQTPILEGRSGPGCAVLDDSIYLVGGYSWSMGAYKSSTICYSPEKGTWTELEDKKIAFNHKLIALDSEMLMHIFGDTLGYFCDVRMLPKLDFFRIIEIPVAILVDAVYQVDFLAKSNDVPS
ncbi:kelch like family member 14 [Turdus rufiventris]|nr:kelch like family member 14 [Turdus rufiventris]